MYYSFLTILVRLKVLIDIKIKFVLSKNEIINIEEGLYEEKRNDINRDWNITITPLFPMKNTGFLGVAN